MTDSDQQPPNGENTWDELKGRFGGNPNEVPLDPGAGVPVFRKRKRSEYSILLIGVAVLAVAAIVLFLINRPKARPDADSDDLGAGVSNTTGLRGHLVTRWQGKALYQLQIVPIDPRENAGFARVTGNPPEPISINIRILDSSGFALCGKEIVLAFDPGKSSTPAARQTDLQIRQALEQERERGKDIFQNQTGADGQIMAINAQGVLPCSADQYKHFDYWDLSTNFPTLDEQAQLLKPGRGAAGPADSESRKAAARKTTKKALSPFYIEGDDTVADFDASSGALDTGENRTFYIGRKSEQATAAAWAANFAHFHYKCDQHAECALQRGGSGVVITARLNE